MEFGDETAGLRATVTVTTKDDTLQERFGKAYLDDTHHEITGLARMCVIATTLFIPLLGFLDNLLLGIGIGGLVWRLPPLVMSLPLTVIAFTPLIANGNIRRAVYDFYLMSIIAMTFGLSVYSINAPHYTIFLTGSLAGIFVVFALHRGSVAELVMIYASTALPFIAWSAFFTPINRIDRLNLINPVILMVIMTVLYRYVLRLRIRQSKLTVRPVHLHRVPRLQILETVRRTDSPRNKADNKLDVLFVGRVR